MAKKDTPVYKVLQDGKEKIAANAKAKTTKKKIAEMNDAEKVEYYKEQLSKEKAKTKELKIKFDILSDFINENYSKLSS